MLCFKKGKEPKKLPYPKSIFFIIGNEFCERFNYYGLRAVLTIYLVERLHYSDTTGTVIYHLFTMIAYFTPLLGAVISDSFLGKYRTILYLSIIYALGCIVLSYGAFPQALETMRLISLIGLFIISFGTGGIKPCVAAFGGDQFEEGQERQLQQFFSVFYLTINAGSAIATAVTPILRADVACFGEKTCYPLAYGVPSLLMILSLIFFICGKSLYKTRPPEGNITLRVSKCVCYAIGQKFKSTEKKKEHWLDYAENKFEKNLIRDIKILLRVLVLYIPLPIFWTLFDQQASKWTLQAMRMDGQLGGYHIKPDQMQTMNPFLIIILIPVFQYVVYPILNKCNILKKPLQRITVGGLLCAASFAVAGFVELNLEKYYPSEPSEGFSELAIINNFPCAVNIEGLNPTRIKAFESAVTELPLGEKVTWKFEPENCSTTAEPYNLTFIPETKISSMMITLNDGKLVAEMGNDTKDSAKSGEPQIRLFYNIDKFENTNITFLLKNEKGEKHYFSADNSETYGRTDYKAFPPGRYQIYAPYNETKFLNDPVAEGNFKTGGVYIMNIYIKKDENSQFFSRHVQVNGNEVSMLYQIPQYVLMTAGEVMFSITGLEFSYSQAPFSMKSVIQAVWLLTVAVGNLITLVVAESHIFKKVSHDLFFFSFLFFADMIIFSIMAYFYKYIKIKSPSEEEADRQQDARGGRSNEGYVEETDFNK